MRLPRSSLLPLALGSLLLVGLQPATALAIQHPPHLRGHSELEVHPDATSDAPRARRALAPRSHKKLEAEIGGAWLSRVDADTGVLAELVPRRVEAPGANSSAAHAQRFALDFIARHIDVLAPGSSIDELILVSDETSNGVRTLGFAQYHAGLPVIGGQLSLSFKADRLIAVRSQALPNVWLPPRATSVDAGRASERARTWVSGDFAPGSPDLAHVEGGVSHPAILPIVHAGGAIEYREVVAVEVALDQPVGRWQVWVDAEDGQPIARQSLVRWAELQIETWRRSPLGSRASFPAAYLEVDINGQPALSDSGGQLQLPPTMAMLEFMPEGAYQRVINDAGPLASVNTQLSQAQSYVWDLGNDPLQDAQLSAYVHTHEVKQYVRGVDPELELLDLQTTVTVNINDSCNAFANENTINFFLADNGCENTALLADVVYHEYGHVVHVLGMQPGVGLFDGGVSEGASDYLAATMTGDPDIGVGFFMGTDTPLRELDPAGFEWRWPEHTGEVHDEGRIIGGTLWDLRTALIEKHGQTLGVAKTDAIWLDGLRRSIDIPSWYIEALITNDDDGDLSNGTPDICEIDAAFAAHGLYQPPGVDVEVEELELADGSVQITANYGTPYDGCPNAVDPGATLHYRPRGPAGGQPGPATQLSMSELGPGQLRGVIPPQPLHTVTQYRVELDWGNGTVAQRPDNRADEWYEHFFGPVTEIWCAEFDGSPDDEGWSVNGEWAFGVPAGGGGDPSAAWEGTGVAGIKLDWPGLYSSNSMSTLTSPVIDTADFETVRLQYRRWLTVEDGYWDRAQITANGQLAWENRRSTVEHLASVHHRDREWRFHDIELSPFIGADGQLSLSFLLGSDGGLELGGWNIDSLCVVGHEVPEGGCGDGYVQQYEQCDDGNLQNGDGCSSGCLLELQPVPPQEPIDEIDWELDGRGCDCTSSGEGGPLSGFAALALLGLVGWRRRVGARR